MPDVDNSAFKLYKIQLSSFYNQICNLKKNLTTSELERAERYHFTKDKHRFIICRSFLKLILSEHTGLKTSELTLEKDAHKKPFLSSHASVFFNVAHSAEYGLIAIGNSPIGVDVEKVNHDWDYSVTAPFIFGKSEINKLANADDKISLFFKYWTRKEAIVKATGKGIDENFIEIPACDGMHALKPSFLNNHSKVVVLTFEFDEHFFGSIAFTGNHQNISYLKFSPLPHY